MEENTCVKEKCRFFDIYSECAFNNCMFGASEKDAEIEKGCFIDASKKDADS